MIIYKITNLVNSKCYIGQTIQKLEYRWAKHGDVSSHCFALNNAIKKYGKDSFKIEKLANCNSKEELNTLEAFYIKNHNSLFPNGYNLTGGGDSHIISDETRKKLSLATAGEKNPFYGKKHSEETKQLIKETRKFQDMSSRWKPIIDSNNNIYKSITEAAKIFTCSPGAISNILRGKTKSTKTGITFSYYKG